MKDTNIGVVIVTYNRIEKLKKALHAFDVQTKKPTYVLVVNNASTDSTGMFLDSWAREPSSYGRYVYENKTNEGGSGGFYRGLKEAVKKKADWIWVSDDDAFPEKDALENANNYLKEHKNVNISAICAEVINNGKIDILHRRNEIKRGFRVVEKHIPEIEYKKDSFEINCFSYVGTIISKKKLKKVGLTVKGYFICYDDSEHSLRLSEVGKILCVPSIKVHHDVKEDNSSLTWKTYYYYRNNINMIKRHFPSYCYKLLAFEFLTASIIKWFSKKERVKTKLFQCAVNDGVNNKLGMHPVYRPGWKP